MFINIKKKKKKKKEKTEHLNKNMGKEKRRKYIFDIFNNSYLYITLYVIHVQLALLRYLFDFIGAVLTRDTAIDK